MIVIYNLSGLVIVITGFLVGVNAVMLSGMLSLGLLAMALVWIALGVMWHLSLDKKGNRRPHPSVFFIPLPIWAVPIVVLSCIALPSDWAARRARAAQPAPAVQIQDPRADLFRKDNNRLSSGAVGDEPELTELLVKLFGLLLASSEKPHNYTVFIQSKEDAALVLIYLPFLRQLDDQTRRSMLTTIVGVSDRHVEGKRLYVGIRGRLYYGAVQTPEVQRIGEGDLSPLLYDYYSASPKPEPVEPQVESAAPEEEPAQP